MIIKLVLLLLISALLTTSSISQRRHAGELDDLRPLPVLFTDTTAIDTTLNLANVPELTSSLVPSKMPMPEWTVAPSYPEELRKENLDGVVWTRILISPIGKVVKAVIFKTNDSRFNFTSLHAAMQWRFTPAIFGDTPGYYWLHLPFKYKINIR